VSKLTSPAGAVLRITKWPSTPRGATEVVCERTSSNSRFVRGRHYNLWLPVTRQALSTEGEG